MFLQSITVYKQSISNDTVLKDWDSVSVNPWDALDAVKAGPIGYTSSNWGPDTVIHFSQFQYDCGADSVSKLRGIRIIDRIIGGQHQYLVEPMVDSFKITQRTLPGASFKYEYRGKVQYWPILLWADRFVVAQKGADQPGVAFRQITREFSQEFNGLSVKTFTPAFSHRYTPMWEEMDDYLSMAFETIAEDVNRIHAGVDSVRTKIVRYRYAYEKSRPTVGVRHSADQADGFAVTKSGDGWSVRLPLAARVRVMSIDGRIVRQFPSGREVRWDARDASGIKAPPGLFFVHAEGLGAVPVLVR